MVSQPLMYQRVRLCANLLWFALEISGAKFLLSDLITAAVVCLFNPQRQLRDLAAPSPLRSPSATSLRTL
jgi:hypothetical protein